VAGYSKGVCMCGNQQESKGIVNGKQSFSRYCSSCKKRKLRNSVFVKKLVCEKCGFKAKHPAQMDIDHKDGNHKNNRIENLQELCANCHRLKTIEEKDYLLRKRKNLP
jgi:hypothetical protein